MGTILTFYSYKGGVGRTMALTNIACILATWKKKVLIVDWDLEAPGIEHFLFTQAQLDQVRKKEGLIEVLTELSETPEALSEQSWKSRLLEVPVPRTESKLSLLLAGAQQQGYF